MSSYWPSALILESLDLPKEQLSLFLIPCQRPRNHLSRMIIDVAYFAAVTILCCASADSVTTSILLPAGLFVTDQPFQPPTFVGEVTVTRSTTYYTLDCEAGTAASVFNPQAEEEGDDGLCSGGSYTFSENLASTQYLYNSYLVEE